MKKFAISFIMLVLLGGVCFAQGNVSDYQRFLSKIQPVLSKNIDSLSKADIDKLEDVISMNDNAFGDENSKLVQRLKTQARDKKRAYEKVISDKEEHRKTVDQLNTQTERADDAEDFVSELLDINDSLSAIIATLQSKLAKFEKQQKKLAAINKELKEKNLATADVLKKSSDLIAQMYRVLPDISMENTYRDKLPKDLVDSIDYAQCNIAQLLKTNFVVTLQELRANKEFMDSAIVYFKTNGVHSPAIKEYKDNSDKLVNRLRASGIDCAIDYAADIEKEMNDFLTYVETGKASGSGFANFILNNIVWLGPLMLVVIVGIIIVITKTSKREKPQ